MVNIVLPISRQDYLKPVFDSLNALDRPSDTELIILTDGSRELERAVDSRLDSLNYSNVKIVSFGSQPASTINDRRYRISAIHNQAKHYISEDCDYVFSIEDDTTYPPDTLVKMLDTFGKYEETAFVEGVQLGRHRTPYVGGWLIDDVYNPQHIESVMPHPDLQRIQAGGLYCALIDAQLYRMHYFEPYDKNGTNGLSCDVNFGIYLAQMGFSSWIDWTIPCDHIGDKGSVNIGNTPIRKVTFELTKNRWGVVI